MLISYKHKFIFIHVAKNAGQSITNALMPFAANKFQKKLNFIIPYRYQLKINTKLKQYTNISYYPQPYSDHIRGAVLRNKMGETEFRSFFSFAIVRNPWEWVLSNYTYACQNPRHDQHKFINSFKNFTDYCEWLCDDSNKVSCQSDYVYDEQNSQVISFIGRFENLDNDFQYICQKIGINASLPRYNVSSKSKNKIFTLEKRTIDLIGNKFKKDIRLFGYNIEEILNERNN